MGLKKRRGRSSRGSEDISTWDVVRKSEADTVTKGHVEDIGLTCPPGSSALPFNYLAIKWIVNAKWLTIKLDRMERLLRGESVNGVVQKEWKHLPEEVEQIYGTWKAETGECEALMIEFLMERYPAMIAMVECEDEIIGLMLKLQCYPSDPKCSELADTLKERREKLEEAFKLQVEIAQEVQRDIVAGMLKPTMSVHLDK